jgi:putative toxin-antitoxin system antitoxin component (TIGR02293 family)
MSETPGEYVVDILGGQRVFVSRSTATARDLRERIKGGLPYRSLETLRERLRLSLPEAAAVLHVPLRTLARRRTEKKLAVDESDRLYRLARIAAHAVSVLGSEDKVAAWLRRPNRGLGGETPIQVLDTDLGARQVEDVLGRIEHGLVG